MKFTTKISFLFAFSFFLFFGKNEILAQEKSKIKKLKNTEAVIKYIQKKQKNWHKKYYFTQKNIYPDSTGNISEKSKTELILEFIQSPNTLAVYPQKQNPNDKPKPPIKLHNDTLYMYDFELNVKQKVYYNMPLVWLSGGLGSYEVKTIFEKLKKIDINPEKFYQNDKVLVIGADNADDQTSSQVHYDVQKGFLTRVFIPNYKGWHEAIFENQEKFGKGWLETKVTIYKDKKIMLSEIYQNPQTPQNEAENKDFDKKVNVKN